jgi:hypothetical protein
MSASILPARRPHVAQYMGYDSGQPPTVTARAGHAKPRDVDELCEQFAGVCESAVDALEISSALEFEGWSDQAVRNRFGVPDVFALAEEMYRRVPRRPAEPEPLPDPWPASKVRPALHGLLYGLPTVCFPAAAGLLTGPGVLSVLIVALLASWALSQALAYLGYARLGQAGPVQAAGLLRAGLVAGLAGVMLVLAADALVMPVRMPAIIFGAGLGAYMLGASVLTVLGAEQLLLAVLAPGVLSAATFLMLGRPPRLEHAAWAALSATPLLALALAVLRTSRDAGLPFLGAGRPAGSGPAGQLLVAAELRGALPSAGFGLLAAGLLVFPVATGVPGHAGANTGALLVSLPLALSMGAAEWTLIWFRRRTQRLLRTTRELRVFATRARLALLAAVTQYLTAAVVLTAAVITAAAETRLVHPHWTALPQIAAYLALGGAMFLALLLQAFGSRIFPLVACAAALAFEVAYRGLGVPAQLVACTELLIVLAGYAALVLGSAIRHAC